MKTSPRLSRRRNDFIALHAENLVCSRVSRLTEIRAPRPQRRRGGFVDHFFAFARLYQVEKLQVQRGVHRAHLRAADVAGKTAARQHLDFALIVVTNVIATGQSEADRSRVIDNRYASLSVWSRKPLVARSIGEIQFIAVR